LLSLPAVQVNTIKLIGMFMKSPNNIWGHLGELPDEEVIHMMTKLFTIYEEKLKYNHEDQEALNFFKNLNNSINLTSQCNLNR
jgi:hypothetical protein